MTGAIRPICTATKMVCQPTLNNHIYKIKNEVLAATEKTFTNTTVTKTF